MMRRVVPWRVIAMLAGAVMLSGSAVVVAPVASADCVQQQLTASAERHVPPESADRLYSEGNRLFERKEFEEAIAAYSRAANADIDFTAAVVAIGNAHFAKLEYDEAMAYYGRAIDRDPGYADAFFARGTAHWVLGNLSDAERDYRRAVDLAPEDSYYYDRLARVLYDENNGSEVERLYESAYRANACRTWALSGWLAKIYSDGDYAKLAETAQSLPPTSAAVQYYSGLANFKQRDYASAETAFAQAIKLDSGSIPLDAYELLAKADRKLGKTDDYVSNMLEYYERTGYQFPGLGSAHLPRAAVRKLRELVLRGRTLWSFSVAPNGDWAIVTDENWHTHTHDGYHVLIDSLKKFDADGDRVASISLGPDNAWVAVYEHGSRQGHIRQNVPASLSDTMEDLYRQYPDSLELRHISMSPAGAWVVTYTASDGPGVRSSGVPPAILGYLQRDDVQAVTLGPGDTGAVVYGDYGYHVTYFDAQSAVRDQLKDLNASKTPIDMVLLTGDDGWLVYSKAAANAGLNMPEM